MNLVFSSVFEADFAELIGYFHSEASLEVAEKWEAHVYGMIEALLKQPTLGRVRKELKPDGIRSFRVPGFERYLLFYRVKGNDLVLLRLRHGAMDFLKLL